MNHKKERPSAEAAVKRAVIAISALRSHSDLLANASEEMAQGFDNMDVAFRVLRATDESDEIRKLHERLQRLREFRNMMELGSYQTQIHRVVEEAWRKLP